MFQQEWYLYRHNLSFVHWPYQPYKRLLQCESSLYPPLEGECTVLRCRPQMQYHKLCYSWSARCECSDGGQMNSSVQMFVLHLSCPCQKYLPHQSWQLVKIGRWVCLSAHTNAWDIQGGLRHMVEHLIPALIRDFAQEATTFLDGHMKLVTELRREPATFSFIPDWVN